MAFEDLRHLHLLEFDYMILRITPPVFIVIFRWINHLLFSYARESNQVSGLGIRLEFLEVQMRRR